MDKIDRDMASYGEKKANVQKYKPSHLGAQYLESVSGPIRQWRAEG